MPEKIELLKVRDFGEIITDTLTFVRQNFKQLFKSFFVFSGFFLFVGALLVALQQNKVYAGINAINTYQPNNVFGQRDPFAIFGLDYFLGFAFLLFGYISLQIAILSFIALYKQKGNEAPTVEEVWGYFKYFFWRVFGSGILIVILLILAFVCCFVPFFYLYPIFCLIIPIMIFENASFGYSFNKSFRLIKNNWWATFGAIIVIGIIVSFGSLIVLLPIQIITIVNTLVHISKGGQGSIFLSVITALCQLISHVLYILPIVTISLCYFNLSEQADGLGLIARINQIGVRNNNDNLPEEEH